MTRFLTGLSEASRKVLAQLRHGPMTVDELGKALRLTNNAVRNQLRILEAGRLVEQKGSRPSASKPSARYAITLAGQIQFSTLYLPVLAEFLEVAESQCEGKQLITFMRQTGKSLAKRYPKPSGPLSSRVAEAARLVRAFGGLMEIEKSDGSLILRSKACPLAALTAQNSAACRVIEGFVAEYASATAKTCCEVGDDPRCCFAVKASGAIRAKGA
ncbi:MAG TPA: helix-turn-helix domain-containing protein [Gemmatimonadaceae bacterium]|nr:helix-turn-helix domain-containing protein [Gemmatimonadaceae bacterium]